MAVYFFVTVWRVAAPIEEVWEVVFRSEEWPRWWESVREVRKLEEGDELGAGSLHEYRWRGPLPYDLSFTVRTLRVLPPRLLEGEARGELEGSGRWELSPVDGGTRVRYTWNVRTAKTWMNGLAPLLRPLFRWNHDWVMAQGGRGLARRLGVELLSPDDGRSG